MHTQNCWETIVCHLRSVTAAEASLHIQLGMWSWTDYKWARTKRLPPVTLDRRHYQRAQKESEQEQERNKHNRKVKSESTLCADVTTLPENIEN